MLRLLTYERAMLAATQVLRTSVVLATLTEWNRLANEEMRDSTQSFR